jgi:hypothetical protein
MKIRGIPLALALTLLGSGAMAQTQPPGVEGKDWAQADFTIANGATAEITATINTINTLNGNTTRIILIVNGRTVVDTTFDKAEGQIAYRVTGDGPYQAVARCLNNRAEAYQCGVSVRKATGTIIQ